MTDITRERTQHISCLGQRCPITCTSTRLVGQGFRLWLTGCKSGDLSYWEKAWQLYSGTLGKNAGGTAVRELSKWVRTVDNCASREFEVLPESCPELCRDECLAVAMIAACQHKTCPAIRACAFALIEHSGVQAVIDQSDQFATTLMAVDQRLSPSHIVNAAALTDASPSEYVQ